ncbi:hypothetical protein [Novosphingobium sp. JCM 18896]|uniref:hypothetical protein n=1 Tax=Novosphingobium sp. JCM 18896 TaxID=2989731 RepID=UPI002222A8D8|nr:hypothetical protein [Novosphingobium sp. JCM 18896]MCW1429526.1 hypothetical protein [Novosphingobium sp. JCM 18896]
MSATAAPTGFDRLLEDLAEVHHRLSQHLTGHDHTAAELTTAMLGGLMASYLGRVCADLDHPAFLPGAGYHQRMGMPNPDTVYLTAAIDGEGVYRLTGDRGTAPEVSLMPMGGPTAAGLKTYPAIDLRSFDLDAEGKLDLVLSARRPEGHHGAWHEIARDVRSLMLRSVSDDWGQHRDPVLAITRLDRPSRRRRTSSGELAARLAGLAQMVEGTLAFGMRKVAGLRANGTVNAVATVDYSAGGGLVGQWYHEGVFDLAEGQVLVVEADLRRGVDTLSLALTDALGCTLDWANAQTSLNRKQAHRDADGFLRFIVSAQDPGVANWLDTTGHPVGVMQLRWTGCATAPGLTFRLVDTEAVTAALPPDTRRVSPKEREAILRARAAGAQRRIYW